MSFTEILLQKVISRSKELSGEAWAAYRQALCDVMEAMENERA